VSDVVLTEVRERTLLITISRPEKRNAVNGAVAQGIASAIDRLDSSPDLAVGVLTGAGPTFCSGMDLAAFLAGESPYVDGRGFAGLTQGRPDKPLIAAVEGAAVAGGFEMVLACDLIVAASNTWFAVPEVKRGLTAAGGALFNLTRRLPFHIALEMLLTGDPISALKADALGLVNYVVDPGTVVARALELAEVIGRNGPLALAATKQVVWAAQDWAVADGFDLQREWTDPVRSSNDAREGALAFTERRDPVWTGS